MKRTTITLVLGAFLFASCSDEIVIEEHVEALAAPQFDETMARFDAWQASVTDPSHTHWVGSSAAVQVMSHVTPMIVESGGVNASVVRAAIAKSDEFLEKVSGTPEEVPTRERIGNVVVRQIMLKSSDPVDDADLARFTGMMVEGFSYQVPTIVSALRKIKAHRKEVSRIAKQALINLKVLETAVKRTNLMAAKAGIETPENWAPLVQSPEGMKPLDLEWATVALSELAN